MTEVRDDMLCGIKRIARYIGKSEDAAQRLCSKHTIPAFKLEGRWHLRQSRFMAMIEDLEHKSS
jgi:hypothetical protein